MSSPRTIACTWTQKYGPGAVVFPEDPKDMPAAKLAETLRHEAHHYGLGWGGVVRVDHTCSDPGCQEPSERACDPIYRTDAYFGPRYQKRFDDAVEADRRKREEQQRAVPELSFEGFLKGAGLAAAFFIGIGLLLKAAG